MELVYAAVHPSLIRIELWDWLKCFGQSLNIRMEVPCNYPVGWTHETLVGKTTLKPYLPPRKNHLFFYLQYSFPLQIRYDAFSEGNISTLDNVPQGCGFKCSWKFKISLLGYRIIITRNHEVLERGKYPPSSVFSK